MQQRDLPLQKYVNCVSFRNKVARAAWHVAWAVLFRPTPGWCLGGWRRFLLRLFGARIGEGCAIHPTCQIWAPWNLEMGAVSCLSAHVDCYSVANIRIGDKVTVSKRAFLCTASHNFRSDSFPLIHRPITIESFVWVAAQAFVASGVTVGKGAVVGACAAVTRDVEPWTVVAGNPAREVGRREIRDLSGRP